MSRKIHIAALGSLGVAALFALVLGGAYYAARQVSPFYQQALEIEPAVLERGSRELESRATALYSDAKQQGQWQALFTAEQINGWLATQLATNQDNALPTNFRDPRVAIARDLLTLGFRTTSGGVETVISVEAAVLLTSAGDVGICLQSVRAGALPLPVMQLADEIATACQELGLPVRWTRQGSQPVAVVEIRSDSSTEDRAFYIDTIELGDNELYVSGHTELETAAKNALPVAGESTDDVTDIELADYELRLAPSKKGAIEIAKRPAESSEKREESPNR